MASVEGVWAKDIEEAFEEALAVYPPCGRRKIILSDEGKMYGRNELIARYIKMRTGKTRTRKQVSSHIQVLSRKRGREQQKMMKQTGVQSPPPPLPAQHHLAPSPSVYNPQLATPSPVVFHQPTVPTPTFLAPPHITPTATSSLYAIPTPSLGAPIVQKLGSPKMTLVEFTAFLETPGNPPTQHTFLELKNPDYTTAQFPKVEIRELYEKVPGLQSLYNTSPKDSFLLIKCWLDLSVPTLSGFYGVTSKYHSNKTSSMKCSSRVFQHSKQMLEKVQVEYPLIDDGSPICYFWNRSPMCDQLVDLIARLKSLEQDEANLLLSDFTMLQTITDRDTNETLLTIVFLFGIGYHPSQVYRLGEEL